MSTSAENYPRHDELDVEGDRVARWRFDQFRSLGFGIEQAWFLAASAADLNLARRLVAAGCPLRLVLDIVL